MATVQNNLQKQPISNQVPPASDTKTESAPIDQPTGKGVVGSPTQISDEVTSGADDATAPFMTYGLDKTPPSKGTAADQSVNQFLAELEKIPPNQIESRLNDLMNLLLNAYREFKKSNMQARFAEMTNQYQATLASADKLMQAAQETKKAGVTTAIFGIVAAGIQIAGSGFAMRSTFQSSKMVNSYTKNNEAITKNSDAALTAPKKPMADPNNPNVTLKTKSELRTEIRELNSQQQSLSRQIDMKNSQAQTLTQGGTAVGGLFNAGGTFISTEFNYNASLANAASKQSDAESQRASANADSARNFMDSAQSNFSSTIQTVQATNTAYNNRVQAGVKVMV